MKVKAILDIYDNGKKTIEKEFDVDMRTEGRLYSIELVEWILSEKRCLGNIFTIRFNNKDYKYSL